MNEHTRPQCPPTLPLLLTPVPRHSRSNRFTVRSILGMLPDDRRGQREIEKKRKESRYGGDKMQTGDDKKMRNYPPTMGSSNDLI